MRRGSPRGSPQAAYDDSESGLSLPYNVFLPEGYSTSQTYPLVVYIADSSLVGNDTTAPLSQYGALIWASSEEQAKHPAIVVVPEYPEVILDDHGSYTTTPYVELTARFIENIESTYAVDTQRVYGTGQSMGCMTVLILASEYPDLFAAEYFVSGQWDINALGDLTTQRFFYIAAGGDTRASGGQTDVMALLDGEGIAYGSASGWDATWSADQFSTAEEALFSGGHSINFANFLAGTVLTANPTSSMEHMASFEPAYKITAARDWLFAQSR